MNKSLKVADAIVDRAATPARRVRMPETTTLAKYALPLVLLVLFALFSLLRTSTFLTSNNITSILMLQSVLAILAIGATIPLIVGEFDLSVGANLGLGAVLVVGLPSKHGAGLVTAIVVAIVACTLIGLINGLLVAYAGLDAFVVTLAASTVISGSVLWYTKGTTIFENVPKGLTKIGQSEFLTVPLPVFYLAAVAFVVWYVTSQTTVGRYFYAIGSSKDASRLAGIRVRRLTVTAFVCSGLLAGVAGILQSAELGSASPTIGPAFLLPAYAAAFLGATSIRPGTFNILGTVLAIFVIAVGIAGLEQMGAPVYVEPIFTGLVLVAGVAVTRILAGRRR